jgi:hypothetical protein
VKRIPVTALEYAHAFSTANLYELPMAYHYGVGSAGFGAFRELAAHVTTTGWVLEGRSPGFPLLYSHRLSPRIGGPAPDRAASDLAGYLSTWGDDPGITRYLRDRAAAEHELVLFLEHVPASALDWSSRGSPGAGAFISELREIVDLLGERRIVHFDLGPPNILVDAGAPLLTDFGLWLDPDFDLSVDEAAFLRRHRDYDLASLEMTLASFLFAFRQRVPIRRREELDQRFGIGPDDDYAVVTLSLLAHLEEIHANRLLTLDDGYVAELLRHRAVVMTFVEFLATLSADRSRTAYPADRLRRLVG